MPQKTFSTVLSFEDITDDALIAATMAQTYISYESAMLIACFVPVLIVILT